MFGNRGKKTIANQPIFDKPRRGRTIMFKGCSTALVTPMSADGSIDYGGLEQLVEFQIANNIQAVLAVGTTGESPTLLWEEHNEVIDRTVGLAKGRTLSIAGTGSNSTKETMGGQRARRPHWRRRRVAGRSLLQWAQLLGDPPRIRRAGGAGLSRGTDHSLHHPRTHRLYDAGGRFGHSRPPVSQRSSSQRGDRRFGQHGQDAPTLRR